MPTLLQLNCTSNWGSTGKIAEQIGLKAKDAGWECYVASSRNANPSMLKNIKVGNMFWTLEHYAENRLWDNEGLASCIPTKRLLKEIDKIHPDVVHLHNIHDHWLNYRILFEYLAEKQIPVVWTQHDQWATTGHCCYNLVGCDRWKTECYDCPLSKWYSLDRSRRNFNLKKNLCAGLKSLTIVPVSEWLADNMSQSHLKNRPIEVIHNGIDINVFKPVVTTPIKNKRIEGKKILLAAASVWSDAKGLRDYIKLSGILPPNDYIIVLVGLMESQIASLPQTIIGLPRTQNVTELVQLYSMAHIVMSLSYSETFGLSIVEGMACGTPAIVYNNTAQKYLIDEQTGLAVETGDIVGVAEAVKMLDAKIEANAEEISVDCRKRAGDYYDKNKNYQSYISLYNKLLGGVK